MARPELVDDGLWELVKPLLADRTPQRTGRSDRTAFTAIVLVLVTGVPWRMALGIAAVLWGDRPTLVDDCVVLRSSRLARSARSLEGGKGDRHSIPCSSAARDVWDPDGGLAQTRYPWSFKRGRG